MPLIGSFCGIKDLLDDVNRQGLWGTKCVTRRLKTSTAMKEDQDEPMFDFKGFRITDIFPLIRLMIQKKKFQLHKLDFLSLGKWKVILQLLLSKKIVKLFKVLWCTVLFLQVPRQISYRKFSEINAKYLETSHIQEVAQNLARKCRLSSCLSVCVYIIR